MRRAELALCGLLLGCAPAAEPPPTAVLVVVDTLRRDALGCYGGPAGASPAIDALSLRGARFEQAIASSGWTLPSVASLFTGAWPELHKAVGHKTLLAPVAPELPLVAERFREAGFDTVAVVNAAFLSPALGLARGFDVYDHAHAYNRTMRRARETVDAALDHAAARAGRPLFLLVHLFDPHLDYDAPAELAARFGARADGPGPPLSRQEALDLAADGAPSEEELAHVRALYQAEVLLVDRAVARLVAGLEELGRLERATLALVADHGEELWDHGGFEHGHTLHDELIRVPLVLKLPGERAPARRVVPEQVRTLDLAATFVELYGLRPLAPDSRSLLPLLAAPEPTPRPAFSQDTLYGTDLLSWRDGRHHLIYDRGAGVERRLQLFDLAADPLGLDDLAAREPELAESLRRELARFYADLRERAAAIPATELQDLSPSNARALRESLESLGYTGR